MKVTKRAIELLNALIIWAMVMTMAADVALSKKSIPTKSPMQKYGMRTTAEKTVALTGMASGLDRLSLLTLSLSALVIEDWLPLTTLLLLLLLALPLSPPHLMLCQPLLFFTLLQALLCRGVQVCSILPRLRWCWRERLWWRWWRWWLLCGHEFGRRATRWVRAQGRSTSHR